MTPVCIKYIFKVIKISQIDKIFSCLVYPHRSALVISDEHRQKLFGVLMFSCGTLWNL